MTLLSITISKELITQIPKDIFSGFLCDTQTVESFKDVEISGKDKFMSKIIKNDGPVAFNEKFKDMFSVFLLKCLNITGHNFMFVPINDEQYGPIG